VIEGYIGRPGSGKSYTLTERALRERKKGRQVFANYAIDGCWYYTPDQLLDLPPGLIIVDEAHLWFPARQSLKLPPSWLAMLSQTRKNGWDLMWAAQHETRCDRVLRDVTSWMWLCSSWFKSNGHPVIFKAACYEPEYFRKPKKKMGGTTKLYKQTVADAYNTHERLVVAEHALSDKDAYADKAERGRQYTSRGRQSGGAKRGSAAGAESILADEAATDELAIVPGFRK
jgi:hypothetical protein